MADPYDEYMKRGHRDLDEATGRGPSAEIERLRSALAASEAARAEAVKERDRFKSERNALHLGIGIRNKLQLSYAERDQLRSDLDAARADAEDEREARHKAETLLEYERNALTAERDESDKALLSVWDLGEGRGMGGAMLAAGVPADPGSNVAAIIKARARQALAAKGDATRG